MKRYFIIDQVIRDKGKATKKQLMDAVKTMANIDGYHEKQFYKDIQDLKGEPAGRKNLKWNCPITQDKAGGKYYYTDPEFALTRITFTTKDRTAIEAAKNALTKLKGFPLFRDLEKVLDRLSENINTEIPNPTLVRTDEFISMESKDYKGIEFIDVLAEKAEKAALKYRAEIIYKDYFSEKPESFVVEPYLLKEYRNRWYCIGKVKGSKIRTFALDRIIKISDLGEDTFSVDEGFSKDEFFKYSYGISTPEGFKPQFNNNWKPQLIKLKFDALQKKYIKDLPLHHSQRIVSETNSSMVITIEVYITIELIKDLRSFGPRVTILSPRNLLEEYAEFEKKHPLPAS